MTAPETTRLSDYERIDYTLRPAKCVERKMICEACQRLVHLHPLSSYQYVGFGSVYFHDFTLFHRQLGLKDMVSIEEDVPNEARFRFNMPYKCVDLLMGRSTEQLEENVSWAQPTILWLDYTCRLNKEVLTDTSLFCTNAQPGSLIIVTVNAHPDEADSQHTKAPEAARGPRLDRLGKLRRRVGGHQVPVGVRERDLRGWGLASVSRQIVHDHVAKALSDRTRACPTEDKLRYRQLFHFRYADGQRMLTTGGVIYEDRHGPQVEQCRFDELGFARPGAKPCNIRVPKLTRRERQHLDRHLPGRVPAEDRPPCVRREFIKQYEAIYKYFPNFAEVEV